MVLRLLKLTFFSLGIAAAVFLILRLFFNIAVSGEIALLIFILQLLVMILLTSKKMATVMADRTIKCPHCGSDVEAAFINGSLAMSFECPACGKIIGGDSV